MTVSTPPPPPPSPPLPTITRDELRARLSEAASDFELLMAASEFGFRAKHIPGSRHFDRPEQIFAVIASDRPIVVYCSNADCHASHMLGRALLEHGYTNVRHYPGGLIDWEGAGLPLEGEWAPAGASAR